MHTIEFTDEELITLHNSMQRQYNVYAVYYDAHFTQYIRTKKKSPQMLQTEKHITLIKNITNKIELQLAKLKENENN